MTSETVRPPVPAFINVLVTAVELGVKGDYSIICNPESIPIKGPTILNFELVAPTPAHVHFESKIHKKPDDKHQLSIPSVSTNGKYLTLSDIHTWHGEIDVMLYVTDKKKEHGFDPQIRNEPQM